MSCSDTTEKSISYIWYFELYDVWRSVVMKICGQQTEKHRMNLSGSYHKGYSQHLQYLDSNKSSPKDLSPPLSEMVVGKLFSIGCCICHHFEEHQTIHHRRTLHAMPLVQAVTTVVAQPRANACKLHCVEHFYSTTRSLTNVMAHMLHIALFKDLCQYVILDQIGLFAL